ncbi:GPW/gp25 family protein [Sphingobacterium daejeonense]|jgi:phage baseplate assembly protein W|uniref:GPW/gp25 family protein n=1 Tax=Sphingobacterium daejeonense TaxID=371142 RepID=A0ABW3RKG2_9SPHI|nr:GPW/gp25 family protein [Sphingobacterium daejeonense]MCT1530155.1 GPW/gp25 family protein [Sphingobacterium daejeonense]
MEKSNINFLGTGWAFPPEFNKTSNTVEMVSAVEDIDQSLNILLSTSLGERVMQPQYGCDLTNYVFETLNSSVIGYLKDRVINAILFYEPRIKVEQIDVTPAESFDLIEGRFTINIEYSVPGTNSRFNYVYDYYLNEALKPI